MFSFRCRSHVQEKILSKNMFNCPLKLIYGISRNFCIFYYKPKYCMQLCINVKTHHQHMNYLKLDYSIFSLKFVSSKCYLQKVSP